jgi:hypothetical protein
VLACGVGAILSHASAATLWTMIDGWWYPLEVTAGAKRSRPGIRTHRCATLTKADTTMHYGIPVTSPARTLHDLTPRLTNAGLIRAVNQAKHARYLRDDDLDELLGRCRNPRLRAVLTPGEEPTRSALEDTFLAFTERHGLPRPHMNAVVHGYCVDAWFPEQRVIVEVDSVEFHSDRWQFEVDRDRDAETLAAGIRTVRITDERMKRHPEREAARLRTILGTPP